MVRAERTRAMHHRTYGSVRASEARRAIFVPRSRNYRGDIAKDGDVK